nr:hypothetical protein [Tanacetum cinerariifolium]
MDLFSLIRAPNPTKVNTGSRPRASHELSLLTLTAPRVIEMDEPAVATDSSGVPSAIEKSPLDFADEAEASCRETAAPEVPSPEEVPITTVPGGDQVAPVAVEPHTVQESRKRGREGIDVNAPSKSLRRDHADLQPPGIPADVSDPDPLAFADAPSPHPADVIRSSQGAAVAGGPRSENVSSPTEVGSPGSVYRPEWGVTNGSLLDNPEACQDLVDHAAPPGYFFELRHMHNEDFLGQYNINLPRQVAMGSQLRLRFEQEAKLLRKSVAQVARREQRIQARESEIKNLEVLLEIEADIKRAAEEKSVGLIQELEKMCAQFSELQGQMVEQRCAEMDVRLDAMSIDFDEEFYPHMLTAIAGRGQAFADVVSVGIAKGMSEGLKHGVEHGHAQRTIESLEAYDPEAEAKFAAALQSLKDLKLPLLDQLEGLKDAPMDVIMASLYLEDDTEDDAPQFIRDIRPSSSQLAIPVYLESCGTEKEKPHSMLNSRGRLRAPCQHCGHGVRGRLGCNPLMRQAMHLEVRDPRNPWACTEEIKLADAIAANINRAEQKKRSRIVCRTHGSAPRTMPSLIVSRIVDAKSAAARVATRLCGGPCTWELDFPRPFRKGTCYVDSPFIERPRSRDRGQGLLGMSCDGAVYLTVTALACASLCIVGQKYPSRMALATTDLGQKYPNHMALATTDRGPACMLHDPSCISFIT